MGTVRSGQTTGVSSKVIDRIRKFLALADRDRSNTTEGEASNAAAAAAKLMMEYNIDEATIIDLAGEEERLDISHGEIDGKVKGHRIAWRMRIARALQTVCGCKMFTYGGQIRATGRRGDLEAFKYLQDMICRQISDAADNEYRWRKEYDPYFMMDEGNESGRGRSAWKNSFRLGCAARVATRIIEEYYAGMKTATGGALIVLDKRKVAIAEAQKDLGLRPAPLNSRVSSDDGYDSGYSHGDKVNIGGKARGGLVAPDKKIGERI